jgi:hypothetical protein
MLKLVKEEQEEDLSRPAAAPRVRDIDKNMVWKLATMMCSYKEIGDIFGLGESTVRRHFGSLIEQAYSIGRRSLRRAQFQKALEGDTRMLIFLGKQYLQQKDTPTETETVQPLPWKDD